MSDRSFQKAQKRAAAEIFWNRRRRTLFVLGAAVLYLTVTLAAGWFMSPECYDIDYSAKFTAPCPAHLFGTDYMGRDMFFRSVKGLSNSIGVGILASAVSSVIALILGTAAALQGGALDRFINWCVDLCMGIADGRNLRRKSKTQKRDGSFMHNGMGKQQHHTDQIHRKGLGQNMLFCHLPPGLSHSVRRLYVPG